MPKNKAIRPSSLVGGDMSMLKNTSDMATMSRMPNVRRASIGKRDRDSFMIMN
jgi:hypothetical protein